MGAGLKILLDTSTLIWATSATRHLTARAMAAVEADDREIWISAASAWEIFTKHRLGRLDGAARLVDEWDSILEQFGYEQLDITHRHAGRAGGYHIAHADPFDRLIAAQAELEQMPVVTSDRAFDLFPVNRLW